MTLRRTLTDALELIARGGCENNTGGRRCWQDPERIRGGHYTSGAWCSACIAQDALGRDKLERGVRPQPDETNHGGEGEGTVAPDPGSGAPLNPSWTGYCALEKVKAAPRCREQCATCRIHDQVQRTGQPGDQ